MDIYPQSLSEAGLAAALTDLLSALPPATYEAEFHSEENQGTTWRIVRQRVQSVAGEITVSLADGTDLAAQKLERVLTNDPAMGVIRHVDAGYDIAERTAAEQGVRIPMREF